MALLTVHGSAHEGEIRCRELKLRMIVLGELPNCRDILSNASPPAGRLSGSLGGRQFGCQRAGRRRLLWPTCVQLGAHQQLGRPCLRLPILVQLQGMSW